MQTPPAVAFSHLGIYVTDLARMEDFYARIVGLLVTDRGNLGPSQLVFLSRDPREHHQLVLCSGRPADTAFNVVNQISFRLVSLSDLRAVHARLVREQAQEIRPINHGISWSVYARDPEGSRLEFFVDTPWYVPQPLREPLDLSLTDEQVSATTEAACKRDPGFKPMSEWRDHMTARITARRVGETVEARGDD